ncbi:MAG: hypothetical protein CMJ50_01340 [Planctomycetaceae bacterium]|nr:hypothetical protein [Planctomycetaceae bacterium]
MPASLSTFLRLVMAAGDREPTADVLVNVFLRGGADGLNLVPPHAEKAYYAERPSLALAQPNERSADETSGVVNLDGFFGLHPGLRPLQPLYEQKQLAVVHAVGSHDQTRSHFEAQDLMERGSPVDQNLGSGWLARHLRTRAGDRSPLSAVAISDVLPESLRGSPGASAVRNVEAFSIDLKDEDRAGFEKGLQTLYGREGGELGRAGLQVLETLGTVDRLRREANQADEAGDYPDGQFGDALRQVARLIKAEVGLEVACVDIGGWDSHFVQAGGFGGLASDLGQGLAAFAAELRPFWNRVTVVTMSEFGRRLHENVSLGTDHGRGGVMFILGGNVRGGRVVADWPGLAKDDLEGPGDLRVTTDYRDILGESVARRLQNEQVAKVFPGHTLREYGIVS